MGMRVIRIESEEDYIWLRDVIERAHFKSWNNLEYTHETQWLIQRVSEQIKHAEFVVPEETIASVKSPEKSPPPRRRKTRSPVNANALLYCATHPSYGAKRTPRTNCDDCWAAYKKLNPTKADAARRKFERTQRNA